MTVGERIKVRRKQIGKSADELAEYIGVSRATMYRYESGYIEKVPGDILVPIAKFLHTTPAYLMGWKDTPEDNDQLPTNIIPLLKMKKVPLLGTIACGEPILAEENVEGFLAMPEHVTADFCLRCKGDSMINARIFDGDIVYIRQQPHVEDGEIAAVLIDSEATLKRVRLYPDHISLEPENPQYRPIVKWGDEMLTVRIIGKAVAFTSAVR